MIRSRVTRTRPTSNVIEKKNHLKRATCFSHNRFDAKETWFSWLSTRLWLRPIPTVTIDWFWLMCWLNDKKTISAEILIVSFWSKLKTVTRDPQYLFREVQMIFMTQIFLKMWNPHLTMCIMRTVKNHDKGTNSRFNTKNVSQNQSGKKSIFKQLKTSTDVLYFHYLPYMYTYWSKETPPGGVSNLKCSLIKNRV